MARVTVVDAMNPRIRRLLRLPRILSAPLALVCAAARADAPAIRSPQVNADQSVTVRYYGPGAHEVTVDWDYGHHPVPLKRGDDGIWSITTAPLADAVHM